MATAEIHHVYNCDEDTFWSDILFDDAFNRRLFLEHLAFEQWEIARFEENDDEIRREIVIRPVTGELPKALVTLVGDNLGFREEGVFDKKRRRYRFSVIPNRLREKLHIQGELYVEPRDGKRCERFVRLEVEAKIFGLGSVIEKRIIADTRESYDKGYAFAKKMLAERASSE